jgi:hypothetical protein
MNNVVVILVIIIAFAMLYNTKIVKTNNNDNIQKLLRQSARWLTASLQDKSPLISMLHAMYGYGYFMALREIATDNEINKYVDLKIFERELVAAMDNATKKVSGVCPQYANDLNKYFAKIAGDVA